MTRPVDQGPSVSLIPPTADTSTAGVARLTSAACPATKRRERGKAARKVQGRTVGGNAAPSQRGSNATQCATGLCMCI